MRVPSDDFLAVFETVSYLQVWIRHRDVVVLALILGQQFEPAANWTSEDLTHSK